MQVNFGGFVAVSTIDWPGRSACVVFLRGCPLRCTYCHNAPLQTGIDMRHTLDIMTMIKPSLPFITGVIFSGGEPTAQPDALIDIAGMCKDNGLDIGIQTSGCFPWVLKDLLARKDDLIDMISLDIKTSWDRYDNLVARDSAELVKESFTICSDAWHRGVLTEMYIAHTVTPGHEDAVAWVADLAGDIPMALRRCNVGTATIKDDTMAALIKRYVKKR